VIDSDEASHFLHPPLDLVFRDSPHRGPQRKREIVEHGEVRIQRILLEDHRHVALRRRVVRDVASVECDRSGVRLFQPGDEAQQCRLARTGWPEQDHEFTVRHGETDVPVRLDVAEALRHAIHDDFSHRQTPRTTGS